MGVQLHLQVHLEGPKGVQSLLPWDPEQFEGRCAAVSRRPYGVQSRLPADPGQFEGRCMGVQLHLQVHLEGPKGVQSLLPWDPEQFEGRCAAVSRRP